MPPYALARSVLTVTSFAWLVFAMALPVAQAAAHEPRDVVIYGGSSAAVTAAVQAKRMGRSVVVVCPDRHLGGLSSGGLGFTDTGDKSVIGGLARDFYHRVWKHYQAPDAWRWQDRAAYGNRGQGTPAIDGDQRTMWIFEPHVAEKIFEAYVAEHGIEVVRDEWLDREKGVLKDGSRIVSITTLAGVTYPGRMFIDATYEGDLMAAAGVDYHVGREANAVYDEEHNGVQVGVLHHRHHFGAVKKPISPYRRPGDPTSGVLPRISTEPVGEFGTGDERVQAYCFRMCLTNVPENRIPFPKPAGYDASQYELLLRILEAGWDEFFAKFDPLPNGKTDTNNHGPFSFDNIGFNYDYPEASYARRREIVAEHATYQQGLLWFVANDPRVPAKVREELGRWGLPKDEFADNGHWSHQLYIREARRMVGKHVMTENELRKKKPTPDSIGMGSYTIDSHNVQRYVTPEGTVQNEGDIGVSTKGPYEIAYGSLVPKKGQCDNLLVPVAVSASHIAYGSIRMEPVFMILGQSAATAAAMAIDGGLVVQDVPYERLRERLIADGQILHHAPPERTKSRAADWPQWRGPARNGVAEGSPPIMDGLPAQGVAPVWTSEEDFSDGGGWSSPVVADGRVLFYTHRQQLKPGAKPPAAQYPPLADDKKATMAPQELDAYEELRVEEQLTRLREFFDQSDAIHCLDAVSGKTLWNHLRPSGPTRWRQSSTPAVAGGRVFYLGADRAMNCLDAADGRLLWTTPLPFEPDSEEPMVSSPVVVGGLVVAGAGRLIAYEVASGRIAWQGDAAVTRGIYSSPSVWRSAAGTRLLANVSKGKTVCVEAETGRMLWSVDTFSERSSPTVVGDLLLTYGGSRKGGVRCHRLTETGAELLWNNQQLSDAGSSPCVTDGLVFVQGGGSLVCLGLDDGKERWRHAIAATDPRYTSPVAADGKVLFAGEGLTCVRAVGDESTPLFDACMRADGLLLPRAAVRADLGMDDLERTSEGQEKASLLWQKEVVRPGPLKCVTPALASGRVYLRTASRVVCYDLAKDRTSDRRPPNILFIFTDDQPYKTVGCYPEAPDWVRTPHIDRLAATGVRFERAYLGAWCMPSRASLLTGRLQHGVESMRMAGTYPGSTYEPSACPFIPAQFRKRGYHTAQIGKWHTGTDAGFGRDWDHQIVWNRPKLPANAGAYYDGQILSFDGEERRVEGYSTDVYTDLACGYIRGDRRPADRPWYLWLCYGAVHGPTTPAKRHAGALAGHDVAVPRDIFGPRPGKPGYLDATQAWDPGPDGGPVMRRRGKSAGNFDANLPGRSHAAWVRQVNECAMAIDEGVGRLLAALEETGQLADTLVVFTSDQGFALGEHGLSVKLAPYDAAIASPLIISRPGTLPEGVVRRRPVNSADVAATLCGIAGVELPWSHHGRDFGHLLTDAPETPPQWPMLLTNTGRRYGSDTDTPPVGDAMFEQSGVPWWVMLRDGKHKYIRTLVPGELEEVYDLEADPEELENLAVREPHRPLLERLRAAAIAELRRTGAGFVTAMPPTRAEQATHP